MWNTQLTPEISGRGTTQVAASGGTEGEYNANLPAQIYIWKTHTFTTTGTSTFTVTKPGIV